MPNKVTKGRAFNVKLTINFTTERANEMQEYFDKGDLQLPDIQKLFRLALGDIRLQEMFLESAYNCSIGVPVKRSLTASKKKK